MVYIPCEGGGGSIMKIRQMLLIMASLCFVFSFACSGGGEKPPEDPKPGITLGNSCESDASCSEGERCLDQVCSLDTDVASCKSDADCADGQQCADGACVALPDDGGGGVAVADRDSDGVADEQDNCPDLANADQADMDGDGKGDLCDEDKDGDGVANESDNCPTNVNPTQYDANNDGQGSACEQSEGKGPVITADPASYCPNSYTKNSSIDVAFEIEPASARMECVFVTPDGEEVFKEEEENCSQTGFSAISDGDGKYGVYISAWDEDEKVTENFMVYDCTVDMTPPLDFTFTVEPGWRKMIVKDFSPSPEQEDANFLGYSIGHYLVDPSLTLGYQNSVLELPLVISNDPPMSFLYNGLSYFVDATAVDKAFNVNPSSPVKSGSVFLENNWKPKTIHTLDGFVKNPILGVEGIMMQDEESGGLRFVLAYGWKPDSIPHVAVIQNHGQAEEDIQTVAIDTAKLHALPFYPRANNFSIAKTDDGVVHISYIVLDDGKYRIRDTWFNKENGNWVNDNFAEGQPYYNTALAAHGDDIWVAYHEMNTGKLSVRRKDSGGMSSPVAIVENLEGFCPSQPSIVVYDNEPYQGAGGDYSVAVLYNHIPKNNQGECSQDAGGTLLLAHCDDGDECLAQTGVANVWSFEPVVANPPHNHSWARMVSDKSGCLHIAMYDNNSKKLLYTTNKMGFTCQPVSELKNFSQEINDPVEMQTNGVSSITVDDGGATHMVWYCNGGTSCSKSSLMYSLLYPVRFTDPSAHVHTMVASDLVYSTGQYNNLINNRPAIVAADDGALWGCYSEQNFQKGIHCAIDWDWPPPPAPPHPPAH